MSYRRTLCALLAAGLMLYLYPAAAEGTLSTNPTKKVSIEAEQRLYRGTDQVLSPAKSVPPFSGAPASFKFEDAPLIDVVHIVLRDVAKVDYVLHPPIAGRVTLATNADVAPDDAVFLLEAALQANGLQLLRDARGTYHIGRPEALRAIAPVVRQFDAKSPLPPGQGAILVPLRFVGASEMATILRSVVPAENLVRIDTVRNLLVLVGSRTQAEGWLDLIATFDVDMLKGMSMGIFPLKHLSIKDVEAALKLVNVPLAVRGAGAGPETPANAGAARASGGISEAFPLHGALRIIPMESLNSVLVVTPRAAYLDAAREWLEKLDRPGLNSASPQLFVYPVQNGSARQLADLLGALFASESKPSGAPPTSAVSPGLAQATSTTGGAASVTPASQVRGSNAAGSALTTVNLGQGARVIADEINNAVLVYTTGVEYQRIEATLKRLDVPAAQVLIEASIIEVTLNDDLKYGLQWMFTDYRSNGKTGTSLLSNAVSGALASTGAGFSYTLRNSAGNVRAILNALAEKSLVKVISSPSLMVLNNHTANITVGNQQPVRIGESVTAGGVITSNIQFKDTGLDLAVTPSVNAGDMVTMQIKQGVTDIGQVDVATGQRSFLKRQIESKVAVRSGETIVLGGLIKDNSTSGESGVPLLHEIPVLGALFGTKSNNANRTELLVIIAPKVVRSDQDIGALSAEMKARMKGLRLVPQGNESGAPAIPAQDPGVGGGYR